MKKGLKKVLYGTTLAALTAACAIVASATSSTVTDSFTYNGMGYTAYASNSSSWTQNYGRIELSTSVSAHYGATANQDRVYVNWQKVFPSGEPFGSLQDEYEEDATRVDANDTVPLGYGITTFSYHEVINNGNIVVSINTNSSIS